MNKQQAMQAIVEEYVWTCTWADKMYTLLEFIEWDDRTQKMMEDYDITYFQLVNLIP